MIAGLRGRRRGTATTVGLGLALLVGACGPAGPTPSPSPNASAGPTSTISLAPADSPSATPQPGSTEEPPGAFVAIDPGLLDLLPAAVAGLPLEDSPEAVAESAGDPALAESAESIAVGLVVDPTTESFAIASVVKLRPGVYDEEFFRDWRDSFDEGVCAQAGGVQGNAQAEIDERTVYIGTCGGGVHTYHVYLEEPDAIVSINAVGQAMLGEELIETLPN